LQFGVVGSGNLVKAAVGGRSPWGLSFSTFTLSFFARWAAEYASTGLDAPVFSLWPATTGTFNNQDKLLLAARNAASWIYIRGAAYPLTGILAPVSRNYSLRNMASSKKVDRNCRGN